MKATNLERVDVINVNDWNQLKQEKKNSRDLKKYYSLLSFSELIGEVSYLSDEIASLTKTQAIVKCESLIEEFEKRSKDNPSLITQMAMMKSLLKRNIELL